MSSTVPEAGFVLPAHAIRKSFYKITLGALGGGIVATLTQGTRALPVLGGFVAFLGLLSGIGYLFCVRVVWIRLDFHGVRGYDLGGSKASVQWSESITLQESSFGFVRGILIKQRPGRKAVFLPGPIASQHEFVAALLEFAPVGHPLRLRFEAKV